MLTQDSVKRLLRATRAAQSGTADQLFHQEAYVVYELCAQVLHPVELAQIAHRYYERVSPVERVALARLFQQGCRDVAHPQARLGVRVDPRQASAAQLAQVHYLAQEYFPQLLDWVFGPDSEHEVGAAARAVVAIAPEAARAVLGR